MATTETVSKKRERDPISANAVDSTPSKAVKSQDTQTPSFSTHPNAVTHVSTGIVPSASNSSESYPADAAAAWAAYYASHYPQYYNNSNMYQHSTYSYPQPSSSSYTSSSTTAVPSYDPLAPPPAESDTILPRNLGNEVDDEMLHSAFKQYKSLAKWRVVRDKIYDLTKGYGFVSFVDPLEGIRALKDMNGKYIGQRPCKLTKSTYAKRNAPASKGSSKYKK